MCGLCDASESALVKSPAGAPVYQGTLEEAQFRKVTTHIHICVNLYVYIDIHDEALSNHALWGIHSER